MGLPEKIRKAITRRIGKDDAPKVAAVLFACTIVVSLVLSTVVRWAITAAGGMS